MTEDILSPVFAANERELIAAWDTLCAGDPQYMTIKYNGFIVPFTLRDYVQGNYHIRPKRRIATIENMRIPLNLFYEEIDMRLAHIRMSLLNLQNPKGVASLLQPYHNQPGGLKPW